MPAPPPESEPAMVRVRGGVVSMSEERSADDGAANVAIRTFRRGRWAGTIPPLRGALQRKAPIAHCTHGTYSHQYGCDQRDERAMKAPSTRLCHPPGSDCLQRRSLIRGSHGGESTYPPAAHRFRTGAALRHLSG